MRPPLRNLDIAVVDVETTGLFPKRNDRIVEISIVRTRLGTGDRHVFTTLVNPNRDVGPTRIHGIRSKDCCGAPTFGEVAGDVFEMLSGSVIAGHNVTFDRSFLMSEFGRLGQRGTLGEPLCTMKLGRHLRVASEGRSLAAYCASLGIPLAQAHSAENDAEATASLLEAFVTLAELERLRALEDLDFEVAPVDRHSWPTLRRSGKVHRRADAAAIRPPQSYLAQLVRRLAPGVVLANSPEVTSYFELLDRVLEDEIVTTAEAEGLLELAEMSGLASRTVSAVHRRYLEALAAAALKDAVVTRNERRELESVAALLGFEARAVDDALAEASKVTPAPSLPIASHRHNLAGKTVCFTGDSLCIRGATEISRQLAEELAGEAGLKPVKTVTKRLDILVAADPHTMSVKGRKAREYGTRIMAEQAFWRALGIEVE